MITSSGCTQTVSVSREMLYNAGVSVLRVPPEHIDLPDVYKGIVFVRTADICFCVGVCDGSDLWSSVSS